MDSEHTADEQLVARLRRLDAAAVVASPGFDYAGLLERHASGEERARRRLKVARGAAVALVVALVGASVWRLDNHTMPDERLAETTIEPASAVHVAAQPRIVRADTYLAVVALEDHIANLDDALNYARVAGAQSEVVRLERTRAELIDSYRRVRYADMVAANF